MAVTDLLKRNPAALAKHAHEAATRALSNAETRREKAVADLAAAETAQAEAATGDTDATPGALEAATRRVRDARDLAAAFDDKILPAARSALASAERGLANAEREATYQAAEAKRKAAAAKLAKEYPDLVTRYAELLFAVQQADDAVEAANANLPDGKEPLLTVEATVRDIPAKPRRIVSDRVQGIWYFQSGERVQRPELVEANPGDSDRGVYRHPRNGLVQNLSTEHCMKLPKRVLISTPPIVGIAGPRLADTPLPPLRYADAAEPEAETQYLAVDDRDRSEAA